MRAYIMLLQNHTLFVKLLPYYFLRDSSLKPLPFCPYVLLFANLLDYLTEAFKYKSSLLQHTLNMSEI